MTTRGILLTCASIVLVFSAGALLFWWVGWRVFLTQSTPNQLMPMPLTAASTLLLSVGLFLFRPGQAPSIGIRAIAAAVAGIALFLLVEHTLGLQSGLERYFYGEETAAVLEGPTAGRPAVETALTLVFLAFALWLGTRTRRVGFDLADVGASAAVFLSFSALIGYFFQAPDGSGEASGIAVRMTLMESFTLFAAAVGALSLNPHGLIASLRDEDAGGAAKRRLLPAAILTPVLLGFLLVQSQTMQILDLGTALALMVTASIVVFMILIERVGRLLSHIAEEQKGELEKRESRAMEVGMTDALTGLLNRRGWERNLKLVEERCQAEGINSCVIAIDLDGLKRINDTLGHQQGDALIKRAANALRTAARRDDFLARLGGDEFAYLAVGCEPQYAGAVLRRLSAALENGKVQASLGYAMRDLAGSLQAAYQEADQAMYVHKRERKSRATVTPA